MPNKGQLQELFNHIFDSKKSASDKATLTEKSYSAWSHKSNNVEFDVEHR